MEYYCINKDHNIICTSSIVEHYGLLQNFQVKMLVYIYTLRTWNILAWRVAIFYVFMVRGRIAAGMYRQGAYEEEKLLHIFLVLKTPPEGTNAEAAGDLYSTVGTAYAPSKQTSPFFCP
jgi:hypothetical protein